MKTKEAIERVRSRFDKWALDEEDLTALQALGLVDVESEDEKTRKKIITYLSNDLHNVKQLTPRTNEFETWIAYLEKQKEQKHSLNFDAISSWLRDHASNYVNGEFNEFHHCVDYDGTIDVERLIADLKVAVDNGAFDVDEQKEQGPAKWSRQSIIDALTKWLTEKIAPLHKKSLDGTITEKEEMFEAALLEMRSFVNGPDFQIGKDTSTDWSGEDERIYNLICSSIKNEIPIAFPRNKELALAYLEKRKEQKPADWSEEDERMRQTAIEACKTVAEDYENSNARFYKCKDWLEYRLKSLRPQPHWKPSEEQMRAVFDASERNDKLGFVLSTLYNDLKKL